MPIYDNHTVIEIGCGIKAFFSYRVGVTCGEVPGPGSRPDFASRRDGGQIHELRQARGRIQEQEKLIEQQRQRLAHHGEQLAKKDRRIEALKERLTGRELRAKRSENVILDGVTLPPKNMRPCGPNFQDDEFYLESAKKEADRLVENLGLSKTSSLLDVGSGPGRLAIGILRRVGEIEKFRGVDVAESSVLWGQKHITSEHPNFQFVHIDVENRRYNPDGTGKDSALRFPFADDEFDIITLYSVFTHMLTDGVRSYLEDFRRILRPDGRIYLTAFLEDGVPDVEENPQGYLGREWKGDLHYVRYNREFFEKLLDDSGFSFDGFDTNTGRARSAVLEQGQRGLYISKKTS